ncbi:MAG: bifunctional glutamate N-acetyltransferase/amino-acid acetyltransferase ArgJ [bacterium]|nr:bifunctional glutamate N-acetyltransferase/amino-acid acetyltransferase ArgJ [bacterium]
MAVRIPGFRASGISCGIKPSGALDLAIIESDRPANVAAVFTRSRVPGAPVVISRQRARRGVARAIVVNSGISNVAMGEQGLRDAREMTILTARELAVPVSQVLVASTGVIGQPLPMNKLREGIPRAARGLSEAGFSRAARAILTTDLKSKLVTSKRRGFSLLGFAKGSGMIQPDMATMLAYVVTDLAVETSFLREALKEAVGPSLNSLTIDGETSTSDTLVVMANGAAGNRPLTARSTRAREFQRALGDVCSELAEKLALDGEGATRIATVEVTGARSHPAADRVARSIANSALVKTALFGADPNWGRIVQAAGAAGVPFRQSQLAVRIGGVQMLNKGEPCGGARALHRAERAVKRKRVAIEVSLGTGPGRARILTTDLSYEYVRINAEYTT